MKNDKMIPKFIGENKKVFWKQNATIRFELILHERDGIYQILLFNKNRSIKPLLIDLDVFGKKFHDEIEGQVNDKLPQPKFLFKNPGLGTELDRDVVRHEVMNDFVMKFVLDNLTIKAVDGEDDQKDDQNVVMTMALPEDVLYLKPILLLPYVDQRQNFNKGAACSFGAVLRCCSQTTDLPQNLRSSIFFHPFCVVQERRENIKRMFHRVYRKVSWLNRLARTKKHLQQLDARAMKRKAREMQKQQEQLEKERLQQQQQRGRIRSRRNSAVPSIVVSSSPSRRVSTKSLSSLTALRGESPTSSSSSSSSSKSYMKVGEGSSPPSRVGASEDNESMERSRVDVLSALDDDNHDHEIIVSITPPPRISGKMNGLPSISSKESGLLDMLSHSHNHNHKEELSPQTRPQTPSSQTSGKGYGLPRIGSKESGLSDMLGRSGDRNSAHGGSIAGLSKVVSTDSLLASIELLTIDTSSRAFDCSSPTSDCSSSRTGDGDGGGGHSQPALNTSHRSYGRRSRQQQEERMDKNGGGGGMGLAWASNSAILMHHKEEEGGGGGGGGGGATSTPVPLTPRDELKSPRRLLPLTSPCGGGLSVC